jgi:hypothetical protein
LRSTAKVASESRPAIRSQAIWGMPLVWCAATAVIIATGLIVPLGGGTVANFGYVFEAAGYGDAFRQGLSIYGLAAAALGAAFMFVPKATRWPFSQGLAWSTFMLMVIGGLTMLVVPQVLVSIAAGGGDRAEGLASMWAALWLEAGAKLTFAGAIVGAATFLDAWMRAKRV